ncbi:MAG: hypothetical protein PUB29_10680 [Bacteroidales bacterium]|nr:hypothetical protein [Bacteroidales bacterium]
MKKNEAELVDNIHADGHPPDKLKTQNMKKQKSHSPELISRPLVTTASQENDAAKIQNKIITTKQNLKPESLQKNAIFYVLLGHK